LISELSRKAEKRKSARQSALPDTVGAKKSLLAKARRDVSRNRTDKVQETYRANAATERLAIPASAAQPLATTAVATQPLAITALAA